MKTHTSRHPFRIPSAVCGLVLTSFLLITGAAPAKGLQTPKWRQRTADFRVFTLPVSTRPHTLRLDVPQVLQSCVDADVFGPQGRLPYRLISVAAKLIAVEVSLSAAA